MNNVHVLNADWTYLHTTTWQDAITLVYKGAAQVVKEGASVVRSVTKEFVVPMIIRLVKQIRSLYGKKVPWSRHNLFTRDKYICQYCGKKINNGTAQVEHVVPRSKGGKTNFDNCVTACSDCNQKKADRLPHEAKMFLLKQPYSPTIGEFMKLKTEQLGIWEMLKN